MANKLQEQRQRLLAICKETNTNPEGIEYLLKYYRESLKWSELDAINYAIGLFENGTIDSIKVLGGKSKKGGSNDDTSN